MESRLHVKGTMIYNNINIEFVLLLSYNHYHIFNLYRTESFPLVLPKALHLFEKLIQHGSIKINLIWQLFIVNVSTLYNALSMITLFSFLLLHHLPHHLLQLCTML
jgi:hypothetical protein